MKCKMCQYTTENKKSMSNHSRYGCKAIPRFSDMACKFCGQKMIKKKPSEQGIFCNNRCYGNWKKENQVGESSAAYKTGESKTRIYAIWLGIIRRCEKTNCKDYHNYGGRGIKICEEWRNSFYAFKNWAESNGYKENLTIERIDVNGNYEQMNCTWIPHNEQSKNRRNVKKNN